jgi:hypothetical protein
MGRGRAGAGLQSPVSPDVSMKQYFRYRSIKVY